MTFLAHLHRIAKMIESGKLKCPEDVARKYNWKIVDEKMILQVPHREGGFEYISSTVVNNLDAIEIFQKFQSTGDVRIIKTKTFCNDSQIQIDEDTVVETLNIGTIDDSSVDFIEVIFSLKGQQGKDQFFFDPKSGKHSFFHTGEFWPSKNYSVNAPEILPFFAAFAETNPNAGKKIRVLQTSSIVLYPVYI